MNLCKSSGYFLYFLTSLVEERSVLASPPTSKTRRKIHCSSYLAVEVATHTAKEADKEATVTMSNGNSYQKESGAAYQPISVNGPGAKQRYIGDEMWPPMVEVDDL
jgi:hypothetical protein